MEYPFYLSTKEKTSSSVRCKNILKNWSSLTTSGLSTEIISSFTDILISKTPKNLLSLFMEPKKSENFYRTKHLG